MPDKYGTGQDTLYCYPGSDVLKNLLNIKEQGELDDAEVAFTRYRLANFKYFAFSEFSLETWKNLHFYLFQDVYEWAGELRMVKISKGSTVFAMPMQIEGHANALFRDLRSENFLCNLDLAKFVERLAYHFGELNMCHPFRDGNGRSQRLLFELIALNAGYALSWLSVDRSEWVAANIAAANSNTKPLEKLFNAVTSQIQLGEDT